MWHWYLCNNNQSSFRFIFTLKFGPRLDQASEARASYVTLSPQQPFSHTESSKTQFISPTLWKQDLRQPPPLAVYYVFSCTAIITGICTAGWKQYKYNRTHSVRYPSNVIYITVPPSHTRAWCGMVGYMTYQVKPTPK